MNTHVHPRVGRVQLTAALLCPLAALLGFAFHREWWSILVLFVVVTYTAFQTLRLTLTTRDCTCPVKIAVLQGQLADEHNRNDALGATNDRIVKAARVLRHKLSQVEAAMVELKKADR